MMNQIFFFSDLHGNLPALEAVIKDIGKDNFQLNQKYFIGDYVNFCAFNDEVINLLGSLKNAQFIEGNHDIYCSKNELDYHSKYERTFPKMIEHIAWVKHQISKKNMKWLASHPKQFILYLKGKKVLLFHGHFEDTEKKIDLYDKKLQNYDYVLCGHTHKPFIQQINQKTIINVGSLGEPLDGDNRASYVVLKIDHYGNFDFTIRRVPYDYKQTIKRAEALKMPFRENMVQALIQGKI